jgi:hypothetical protein
MPLKSRMESDELKIWRFLNARMELTEKEKKYYLNKEKGFEGEVKFDLLTEKLSNERIIVNYPPLTPLRVLKWGLVKALVV